MSQLVGRWVGHHSRLEHAAGNALPSCAVALQMPAPVLPLPLIMLAPLMLSLLLL
jgi:hypothetical protein